MNELGYISDNEFENAKNETIRVSKYDYDSSPALHFSEYIRRELEKIDSELGVNLYKDGLNIHTSLDSRIQSILTNAFNETMVKNQKIFNKDLLNNKDRLDYVSKKNNISIDSLKKYLENNLDTCIFEKQLLVQGSAVVIDPIHGSVLGMIEQELRKNI